MRSINLLIKPQARHDLELEAKILLVELLNRQINLEAYQSILQLNPLNGTILSQIRIAQGREIETFSKATATDAAQLLESILAIVTKAAGLLPDKTFIDFASPALELNFTADTYSERIEFLCIASMPANRIPGATFMIVSGVLKVV